MAEAIPHRNTAASSDEHDASFWDWRRLVGNNIESLNVRAVYLHTLSDVLQSVAAIFASLVLSFF